MEDVAHSPEIELDKPVSRQHEADYDDRFGPPYYWAGSYVWNTWAGSLPHSARPDAPGSAAVEQGRGDSHLRDSDEVSKYRLEATDGEIGHVEDFIIDDKTWKIRYMQVGTSNWWFGQRALVCHPSGLTV